MGAARVDCKSRQRIELRRLVDFIKNAPDGSRERPSLECARASTFLDQNGHGLEFYDLNVERDDREALLITGQIRNIGRADALVPAIRLTMTQASGAKVFEHYFSLSESVVIEPGDAIGIKCTVADSPTDAGDLEMVFASR